MPKKRLKIGVCTGGGDCPGLNAGIRAITRYASLHYGWEVIGIAKGLSGLMMDPPMTTPLNSMEVEGIIERGGTILGTSNQGSPFRHKDRAEPARQAVLKAWKKLKLDALIVFGGDGTQRMARELSLMGLEVVGIPKTIDNDLTCSEEAIGFSTAVELASQASRALMTSAHSHERIMLLEVMGRDAGHIALHAGIASGAHIILIPEIAFTMKELLQHLKQRLKTHGSATSIVVAEGVAPQGEEQIFQTKASGGRLLGGISTRLAFFIQEQIHIEARATILGHLQRGAPPNAYDRILASQLAIAAVDHIANGQTGIIVGIKGKRLTACPYTKLSEKPRLVHKDHELLHVAQGLNIWMGQSQKN